LQQKESVKGEKMRMKKTKGMLYFDNIYILGKILKK